MSLQINSFTDIQSTKQGHGSGWDALLGFMATVTIRPHASGPEFLLIYIGPSFRYVIAYGLNDSKTFVITQCIISNHFL